MTSATQHAIAPLDVALALPVARDAHTPRVVALAAAKTIAAANVARAPPLVVVRVREVISRTVPVVVVRRAPSILPAKTT